MDFKDLTEYKEYWNRQLSGEYRDVAELMLAAVAGWDTLEDARQAIDLAVKEVNEMQKTKQRLQST